MSRLRQIFSGRVFFARGGTLPPSPSDCVLHERQCFTPVPTHTLEQLMQAAITEYETVPEDGAAVRAEIAYELAEAQNSMPYESDEPSEDSMVWWQGSERSLNQPSSPA